mmetsp:Transcript_15216/g.30932  ORF Transcript_15216/g.30932 Transcript_15216/m.30932 type:complete len:263 (-) Transcript_15216:58-846(-)
MVFPKEGWGDASEGFLGLFLHDFLDFVVQLAGSRLLGMEFDAVVVPGGGLDDRGHPHPWVCARLDCCIDLLRGGVRFAVLLSRGTTHRPPPLESNGFAIDESWASARYLMERGIEADRLLLDRWSLDTIGNAAFARLMICEPLGLRRLVVVTNEFHMLRCRDIFEWVFHLDSSNGPHTSSSSYTLHFQPVPNAGMDEDVAKARSTKELDSISSFQNTKRSIHSHMGSLMEFLLTHHQAYKAQGVIPRPPSSSSTPDPLLKSY